MASRTVAIPVIGAIAMTRVLLGAGIGLLIAGRFNDKSRRTVGRRLLSIGIASTVPLAWRVLRSRGDRPLLSRMMA
jgi:hypothetical protein